MLRTRMENSSDSPILELNASSRKVSSQLNLGKRKIKKILKRERLLAKSIRLVINVALMKFLTKATTSSHVT